MSVICDAWETVLSDGVSTCCGADVRAELRAFGDRSICQACGDDCKVVDPSEYVEGVEE